MAMLLCLHKGNTYTKRKLRVWRDQKCIPLVGAITPLNCAGRHNGTVFAPRKYLYQKEATGMERPEIYSVSRCNNHTYLCGPP